MTKRDADFPLLGRRTILDTIDQTLQAGRSVLLVGPPGIGKSALIRAATAPDVMVVDPFEGITAQQAACIRRSMERGTVVAGATRSLNRASLGKVGRIMWMFTTVRIPPLAAASMRRLLDDACAASGIPASLVTRGWTRDATKMARGRPGVALTVVQHAAAMCDGRRLPTPAAAYLEATIRSSQRQTLTEHPSVGESRPCRY